MDNNLDSGRDITNYSLNDTVRTSPLISSAVANIGLFAQHVIWSGWLVRNNLLEFSPDYNRFGYSSPSPTYRTCTRIHGGVYEGSQLYIYCNNSFSSTQLQ